MWYTGIVIQVIYGWFRHEDTLLYIHEWDSLLVTKKVAFEQKFPIQIGKN